MTYCIGLNLDHGLILASDSRTNAGVDDIRRTGKMRLFVSEGEYMVATHGQAAIVGAKLCQQRGRGFIEREIISQQ